MKYPAKMKTLTYLLLLIGFSYCALAQPQSVYNFPDGVYMTLEQLKNRTPQTNTKIEVIKRTKGNIGFNGGNDYELTSTVDSLNKKFVKKEMFAYVINDSIFLNCGQYKLSTWYALCLTKGNFLAFKGAMSNSEATDKMLTSGLLFGAIGGGIAGAKAAKKRYLYVLSLRTGNVRLLTKEYMIKRLKENQELLFNDYNKERNPESEDILLKYVSLLNQVGVSDKELEEK